MDLQQRGNLSPDTLARASTRLDNWEDCIRQVHDVLALHAERLGQEPSSKIFSAHIVFCYSVCVCVCVSGFFRPVMLLALLHPFLQK